MDIDKLLQLREQLRKCPSFKLDDDMDYPEISTCKIRGYIGQWSIIIEWQYVDEPETVWLETFGINLQGKSGECSIHNLGAILNTLV